MTDNIDATLDAAIESHVRSKGDERQISCSQALDLAAELGVEAAQVGERCDQLGVKIRGCQLGCF